MTTTTPPPLTTTFVPPAACTTDTYLIENLSGTDYPAWTTVTTGLTGWWLHLGPTEWSSCFPSGYATSTQFYFSPGLCPSGYWTAYQTANVTEGSMAETSATCCPLNYKVQTESRLDWFTTNQCTSRHTELSVWTFTQGSTVSSSTTTADGINARGISIRWRASDRVPQTTTSTEHSIPTSTQQIAATETSTAKSISGGGLSTGAKAGIGVGVSIGALLLLAGAISLWTLLLKKKRSQTHKSSSASTIAIYPKQNMGLAELENSEATYKYAEADSRALNRPIYEIGHSKQYAAELPVR